MIRSHLASFHSDQRQQRIVLIGLTIIAVLLLALLVIRHLTSPAPALDETANALEAAGGFTVEGAQRADFSGPETVQGEPIAFRAAYAAPDSLTYSIIVPLMNEDGEERKVDFNSITVGDRYWVHDNRFMPPEGYIESEFPLGQGMDLESARLLPQFLRNASDLMYLEREGDLDGEPAIIITGYGDAQYYPGVIFTDFIHQTAKQVPFVIWIDPDTHLPMRMELAPRQSPVPVEGQELRHETELTFIAFGAAEQSKPVPLVTPAPMVTPIPTADQDTDDTGDE